MTAFGLLYVAQSGVTFGSMMRGIPHDGPSFVVYGLLLLFIVMIWRANRPRKHS